MINKKDVYYNDHTNINTVNIVLLIIITITINVAL